MRSFQPLVNISTGLIVWALICGCSNLYAFDTLNQLVHESRAVRRCYRMARDIRLSSFSDCSIYAQSHLVFFGVSDVNRAATGACIASLFLAIDEQADGLSGQAYTFKQNRDIAADCKRSDVDSHFVRNFLAKYYHMLPAQII